MFRKSLVVRALAIAFGATAISMSVAPLSYAQSNATGTVFGTVPRRRRGFGLHRKFVDQRKAR
jgi:hypothetical protein